MQASPGGQGGHWDGQGGVGDNGRTGDAEFVESSDLSVSDDEPTWIAWFTSLRGNEFFCEIDEEYIQDDFNLTGLSALVPHYDYALDMILDVDAPDDMKLSEEQHELIESASELLYGMIHARYILTSRGLMAMAEKYANAAFGRCPRVMCQGQPVLPVGRSDMPREYTVNVYCPQCQDIFHPKSSRAASIDGAYFGTTFPHLFLLNRPNLIPAQPVSKYVPRIYGFRINKNSVYYRALQEQQSKTKELEKRRQKKHKDKDRPGAWPSGVR